MRYPPPELREFFTKNLKYKEATKMKKTLMALLCLSLFGCAPMQHPSASQGTGTPMANPALGMEFKQEVIPADKAMVYLYRPAGNVTGGMALPFGVRVNGKDITTLVLGGYYPYICDPGRIEFVVYEVGFMAPRDTSSVSVTAQAGEAYYLKGSHGKGAIGRGRLEPVSQDIAAGEITGCKLITLQ